MQLLRIAFFMQHTGFKITRTELLFDVPYPGENPVPVQNLRWPLQAIKLANPNNFI